MDDVPDSTDNSIIEVRISEIRSGDPEVQTIERHLRNKCRSFPTPGISPHFLHKPKRKTYLSKALPCALRAS